MGDNVIKQVLLQERLRSPIESKYFGDGIEYHSYDSLRIEAADALLAEHERAEKAEAQLSHQAEAMDAYQDICERLDEAIAREAVLRERLQLNTEQFKAYARMHQEKGTQEGFAKAEFNDGIASENEKVIATTSSVADTLLKVVEVARLYKGTSENDRWLIEKALAAYDAERGK